MSAFFFVLVCNMRLTVRLRFAVFCAASLKILFVIELRWGKV
jgi:hypothetical protein